MPLPENDRKSFPNLHNPSQNDHFPKIEPFPFRE